MTPKNIKLIRGDNTMQAVSDYISKYFTDVSQSAIAQWENGKRKTPRYYVYFLKKMLRGETK